MGKIASLVKLADDVRWTSREAIYPNPCNLRISKSDTGRSPFRHPARARVLRSVVGSAINI